MKNKASSFLKRIISALSAMAKSKALALKTKTSAVKTRLIIFSLLRNKKILMSSITHKLQSLLGHQDNLDGSDDHVGDDQNKAIVLYNALVHETLPNPTHTTEDQEEEKEENEKYPDLRHSMFESEDLEFDEEDPSGSGSVIEMVRNSKEEQGEGFSLEDEIDHVADLFIKRFHRQMRMQKQQSFKRRYQEMLERST